MVQSGSSRSTVPNAANALDGATMGGIGTAFADAEADDSVQVVVLTGAGNRVFCAGMDLKAQGDERTPPAGSPGLEVLMNRCYPKPVIAAVNGAAMGGGFELVMASDLAVVADHVTFGVPEVKRGVVGAGCSTRTAARVPPAIAYEMTLTGDPITAQRALELGLVNDGGAGRRGPRPRDDVRRAHRRERAHRLAHHEADRVGRVGNHNAEEWAAIRAKAAPAFASDDAREGAAAFAERRTPNWTGK